MVQRYCADEQDDEQDNESWSIYSDRKCNVGCGRSVILRRRLIIITKSC